MGRNPRYDHRGTTGSRDGGPTAPHRTWLQRGVLALGILAVLGCLSASGYVGRQTAQLEGVERFDDLPIDAVADDQPQNWLVVGSDTRDVIDEKAANAGGFLAGGKALSSGKRSDTIMVVRIDPNGDHIDILSLQRDLYLRIAGTNGSDRINSAYSHEDGKQRLMNTIRMNLNIDINHYVEINFQSFQGIVDAVGGVPMYFDKPMRDSHTGLAINEPGCVKLDGEQALAFARSRYLQYKDENGRWRDDGSSDLGRISRQQYFMRKMFDRAASAAKNPKAMSDLIGVANSFIGLDRNIDVGEAASMVGRFGKFQGESISSFTLPTHPMTTRGGADVLELEPAGAVPILNRFRGLDEKDADPRMLSFPVEDGSGVPGRAEQVAQAYAAIGYKASAGKIRSTPVPRTQIRHGFGGQDAAAQLERHLTAGAEVVADPSMEPSAVVLVVGQDLTTVMKRPRPFVPLPLPAIDPNAVPATTAPPATTKPAPNGKKTTTTVGTTTTTGLPQNNTANSVVGIVPGQPPEGVVCT